MSLTCWDCKHFEEDLSNEESTKGFCRELMSEVCMCDSVNLRCEGKCELR